MNCPKCGATIAIGDFPFCKVGPSDHQRGTAVVVGDECDFVQKNGTKEPIHFRSKLEHKRWLKANGYRINDAHVGGIGSDKSTETISWTARMDDYTANNVRTLLERAFQQTTHDEPPLSMHITTTVKDLTTKEAKQYAETR